MGKDAINGSLDPWDRAQKLLVEIQKRSLAEQVMLLSWDTRRETCQTLALAPVEDEPLFSESVRLGRAGIQVGWQRVGSLQESNG